MRTRRVLAIVLEEPVLRGMARTAGNLVFDGFAKRFVGLGGVRGSVVLAEGAAVGADFELFFGADDVSAFGAVEEDGVDGAHAMAFRFGWE